jgi:hypothetical protein
MAKKLFLSKLFLLEAVVKELGLVLETLSSLLEKGKEG